MKPPRSAQEKCQREPTAPKIRKSGTKKTRFLKNKAGELLKTKGNGKKQTGNKPETKRAILLKTNKALKNKPKTNRKTKLSNLLKTKGREKDKPETQRKIMKHKLVCRRLAVAGF